MPRGSGFAVGETTPPRVPGIAPAGLFRDKYRLVSVLGEGPHGISYLAEHIYLRHPYVVKLLPSLTTGCSAALLERLRDQARVNIQIHDPNVVRLVDCDVIAGRWYFVMEFVEGLDLAMVLRQKQRLCWEQALQVALEASQALAAIHEAGSVHQNIKPANLLLGVDGRLRVADLGVAALCWQLSASAYVSGGGLDRLAYCAPEVLANESQVSPAADLYSLGAALYHLLTGRLPHEVGGVFQRLMDLQSRPVAWPADMLDDVPGWLVAVVLRLLAVEPRERFPSAQALIDELKRRSDQPIAPRSVTRVDTLQPRGIGVFPLANQRGTPDDDWLGYEVASYLSRSLADMPDVYVADQDGLVGVMERLPAGEGAEFQQRLLEAGRRVGAATILTGRFERSGGRVRIEVEVLRAGQGGAVAKAVVEGLLAELSNLERSLLERLTAALGLGRAAREPSRPAALAAREKFVHAKQAYLRGDYEMAINLAQQAAAVDPEFGEAIGMAGICLARLGRYDEAEAHHRRQRSLAERWGDARGEIEALANLGVMYYFRGDYEAAERHYRQAASLAEQRGLAAESAQIFNNLGFALYRCGRLEEAERAFQRAIDTHRSFGGLASLVGPYNGLGNVLAQQKRYDEARRYYRRALALALETGDRASVGATHTHLGYLATQEGRYREAKHEFAMALNALEETRFWNGLARVYEYVADLHLRLGDAVEAARCADQRIELARQHANVRMEQAAWLQKAEALRRLGLVEEAAECQARGRAVGEVAATNR